ncbi:unnamed protein product [Peniophora sp. CBMAI 1063]|nr:unnamed protein product [Peniophora sp. CBMAI 1063]
MLLPTFRAAHPRRLSLQPMMQLRRQSTVSLLDTHPVVRTFHPKRLQPSDYLDLSLQSRYSLLVANPSDASSTPRRVQMHYQTAPSTPFPPDTRGFFYYSADGMLRFRLAESSSPADFAKGRDLELPNGIPWRLDARRINTFAKWAPIRDLITASSPSTTSSSVTLGSAREVHDGMNPAPARANIVTGFGEPFLVNFGIANASMYVRRPDGALHAFKFRNPLAKWEENAFGSWMPVKPWYYGSALCAFEPSPFPEDAGSPTIVLRILRILPNKLLSPGQRRSLHGRLSPLPFGAGDLIAKKYKGQDSAWRFKTGPGGDMGGALHRLWELPRAVSPVLVMSEQGKTEGSRA